MSFDDGGVDDSWWECQACGNVWCENAPAGAALICDDCKSLRVAPTSRRPEGEA